MKSPAKAGLFSCAERLEELDLRFGLFVRRRLVGDGPGRDHRGEHGGDDEKVTGFLGKAPESWWRLFSTRAVSASGAGEALIQVKPR